MRAVRAIPSGPIEFTLSAPYKLLNPLLRMHWASRRNYAAAVSSEIAIRAAEHEGRPPMSRARVTIERHSVQEPDEDGLIGGAKLVIDALLVRSKTHPLGNGFLLDDRPACMELIVRHVKAKRAEQRTTVLIEPLIEPGTFPVTVVIS